jgi:peptide/nickel transport system permease protein
MQRLIWQRLGMSIVTLIAVSIIVFGAVSLLPGDVAEEILGQNATPETVAELRRQLGLDRPAWTRYFAWIGNMLSGDFGRSLASDVPVRELITNRLRNTLFLSAYAALFAIPLSIALGLLAALYRGRLADRAINMISLATISLPEFLIAYALIFLVSVSWGLLPSIAKVNPDMTLLERLYRTTLPALVLTLGVAAHIIRMTRSAIVNVLAAPYIEMARLKGLRPRDIVLRHALPNALAPILNVVALTLAYLIVGVVIVEQVFAYPGLGQLMVDAVAKRDLPVVQAASLIFATTYVLLNMLADILAIAANPRLRHGWDVV